MTRPTTYCPTPKDSLLAYRATVVAGREGFTLCSTLSHRGTLRFVSSPVFKFKVKSDNLALGISSYGCESRLPRQRSPSHLLHLISSMYHVSGGRNTIQWSILDVQRLGCPPAMTMPYLPRPSARSRRRSWRRQQLWPTQHRHR